MRWIACLFVDLVEVGSTFGLVLLSSRFSHVVATVLGEDRVFELG